MLKLHVLAQELLAHVIRRLPLQRFTLEQSMMVLWKRRCVVLCQQPYILLNFITSSVMLILLVIMWRSKPEEPILSWLSQTLMWLGLASTVVKCSTEINVKALNVMDTEDVKQKHAVAKHARDGIVKLLILTLVSQKHWNLLSTWKKISAEIHQVHQVVIQFGAIQQIQIQDGNIVIQ